MVCEVCGLSSESDSDGPFSGTSPNLCAHCSLAVNGILLWMAGAKSPSIIRLLRVVEDHRWAERREKAATNAGT